MSGSTFSQNNVSASYSGGGIYNQGTLSVAGSTFSSNTAGDGGGGISNYSGTLTVSNSTFSGNSANNGSGGAIYNGGPLTVIDSTFSGNSASFGGAIDDENTVTVSYSTFFDNTAPGTGGGAVFIDSSATATFKATLMVSNAPGNSCDSFNDSGILVSDGYNLEDGTTCNFTQSTDQSNATTAASYLGSLANNGGPTQTFALLSGSTAIDAIPLSACTDAFFNPVPTDQRGIYRPQGSGCDIGAFELTQTPSANVCPNGQGTPTPCSASIPLTYYVPAGTTLSSTTPVKVVTQGATGLDFAQVVVESCVASGRVKPNCSAAPAASARRAAERTRARASAQFSGVRPELISIGGPCSSGLQGPAYCDVLVTFTPLFPGVRLGASTLLDSSGNTVASYPLSGLGQAPLVAFPQGPQTTVVDGVPAPFGLAFDGTGNLFVSSIINSGSSAVVEFPAAGGQTTLATDVSNPGGIAVDGAGNVFVADFDNNRLAEFPPGGVETTVPFPGLHFPIDVFVDGSGDLFVADFDNFRIVEEPAGCQAAACQTTVVSQANLFSTGVAPDAAGNLFTNDGTSTVYELPVGGTLTPLGTNFSSPEELRLDAADDVFVADFGNSQVVEIPAGCSTATCQLTVGNGIGYPEAVATDGAGNVYIGDNGNGRIVKVNRSQPPALSSFAGTTVGQTSQPQTFTVQNAGNGPLTFSSIVASTNFTVDSGSTTCSTSTPLAVGGICTVGVDFAPTNSGPLTGTLTLSDNSLNTGVATSPVAANRNKSNVPGLPPATQVLSLQGNGVQNTVQVTVSTNITGPSMSVDGGTAFTGSQQFTWTVGTQHTFSTTSPQTPTAGTEYTFANWPDATTNPASDTVTASASVTSYTATFNTLYSLTTAANPSAGGKVTPTSGAYYPAGTVLGLGATANAGYSFSSWTGNVASANSASTTVTMNAPQSVTANFIPVIAFSPPSIGFGTVTLWGGTSQYLTVTSNTAATVKFSKISLGSLVNVTNQDLTYDGGCMSPLPAGKSCKITLSLWPSKVGNASAVLTLQDTASGSPQKVGITATVIAPKANVSPSSLSFGTETVGNETTAKTVTLSNPGIGALTISGLTITGSNSADFVVTGNTCGGSLAAGSNSSCAISVSFKPKAKGSRWAILQITDNAQSHTQTVWLSGIGH